MKDRKVFQMRMDDDTSSKLDFVARTTGKSKTEVTKAAIDKLFKETIREVLG